MLDPLPQPQKALPHSEESERAVLAAVLIHPPLLATVSGRLTPDDFYVERHGLIYQAMLSLQDDSVEVDLRTLQAKLEQRDQLDAVGGVAYLAGLDVDLPDLGRLESYVDIVKERSVRRRLIDAATSAIRHSLDGGLPAQEALGLAEQAILSLGEETVRRGFVPLGEVLHEAIEEIEERPGKALTGLPTGFVELDAMTRGLNPGNLIIIAGRPGMGKSSLSGNIAQYVAIHEGKPVGIFSLEMGSAEIARRILASEADIPSHALVSGHMSKQQWQKVVRTARRIDQAPLLIDDSANPTLLEIASKARRLRAERGLELIIVDYLQLMQAGGRYENRNLELGAISRGLKQLAKELNIPVIALSQLSRQPERRGKDHRPQLADLRECVPAGTLVCLANGERTPIERLVGTTPDVVAVSEVGRLQTARAERVWSVGTRRLLRVSLASGRQIRATADHRLLGAEGWVRIGDLAPGSRIAIARRCPEPADPIEWPDDRVLLLGHLVGDGSYLKHQPLRYTTGSPENSQAVRAAAETEFGATVNRHEGRGNWHQLVFSGNGNRWHLRGINRWLRELGIFDQRSHEKQLPAEVFRFSNRQCSLLLRHLWATDGTINLRTHGQKTMGSVSFTTASRRLAEDVAALLLRLGIVARIVRVVQGSYRPWFMTLVSGAPAQQRFLDTVGAFGPKREAAERLQAWLSTVTTNTNVDTLPNEIFRHVRNVMAAVGISHRQMARLRGTSYGGSSHFSFSPSREMIAGYARILGDDFLRQAAESDLFWDRVVEVVDDGEEEVFDLTVPGPNCWLADGIVSHNSGNLEQDADMVAFIYREEVYDPENPEVEGIAEFIIAKHRNGALGRIRLAFLKETTTFKNLARGDLEPPTDVF